MSNFYVITTVDQVDMWHGFDDLEEAIDFQSRYDDFSAGVFRLNDDGEQEVYLIDDEGEAYWSLMYDDDYEETAPLSESIIDDDESTHLLSDNLIDEEDEFCPF